MSVSLINWVFIALYRHREVWKDCPTLFSPTPSKERFGREDRKASRRGWDDFLTQLYQTTSNQMQLGIQRKVKQTKSQPLLLTTIKW